jgi:phage FluMu gp28-like protein
VIRQPWWESPITDREDVEKDRSIMPVRQFEAEYCCVFHTDSNMVFVQDEIKAACILDKNRLYERNHGGIYTAGIDLGQRVDHSVLTVLECIGPIRRMVFHYRWDLHKPWGEIVAEMDDFIKIWNPKLVVVDRTGGNGKWIFEGYLVHLGWNIEGWLYSNDSKAEIMRNLQLAFEQRNLELWGDETLMRELSRLEEKRLPGTNKPQYFHPKHEHDDQVQSLALACMAAAMYLGQDNVDSDIIFEAVQQEASPFADHTQTTSFLSEKYGGDDLVDSRGSIWDMKGPSPWGSGPKNPW